MSEQIVIKPYQTKTNGGNQMVITHLNNNKYLRFRGYYLRHDGSQVRGFWDCDGQKCNGSPSLNFNVDECGILEISRNAKLLWNN